MWFENELMNSISVECDTALDERDTERLLQLSEECRSLAVNQRIHKMLRAKYYYNSFTCLSNYMAIMNLKGREKEIITEKVFISVGKRF